MVPGATAGFVWLVRTDMAYGLQRTIPAPVPLGFALAQIGSLGVFDRQGTLLAAPAPGEAVFLPDGATRAFGSADGDPTRFFQIALVATESLPQPLQVGTHVSEPFTLLAGGFGVDLSVGNLGPNDAIDLTASAYPALLLVSDGIITLREADGDIRVLGASESALLDSAAHLRNASQQQSSFAVARIAPAAAEREGHRPAQAESSPTSQQRLDPALDAVWERNGCPLNPANPACLTIAQAATCAISPDDTRCQVDSDGDGCADVAEVRLGLDAFNAIDCLPDAAGQPAVNCLFPITDRTCGRRRRRLEKKAARRQETSRGGEESRRGDR
jgi:hypothetical protein